jgi:hypothetical protein
LRAANFPADAVRARELAESAEAHAKTRCNLFLSEQAVQQTAFFTHGLAAFRGPRNRSDDCRCVGVLEVHARSFLLKTSVPPFSTARLRACPPGWASFGFTSGAGMGVSAGMGTMLSFPSRAISTRAVTPAARAASTYRFVLN